MGISAGDAVLVLTGDSDQLDQALDSIPAKAKASFSAASTSVQQFQDTLDATGDNADFAGSKLQTLGQAFRALAITGPDNLRLKLEGAQQAFTTLKDAGVTAQGTLLQATIKVTERQIAYNKAIGDSTVALQQQLASLQTQYSSLGGVAVKSSEATAEVGHKASESFHEASGAAILLSDTVGVRLSRELRGIATELPGIGLLLQAAFIPTAIFGFIEVLISASEKLEAFVEKPRLIEEAWRGVGDSFATVDRSLTSSLDSTQAKIIGLTQGPIAQLDFEIKHLGTDALEVSGFIGQLGDSLTKALTINQASKFNPLSWWNDSSREVAKEATIFFDQLKSNITQLGNAGGLVAVKTQIQEVGIQIEDVNAKIAKESGGLATGLFQEKLAALEQYKQKLQEAQTIIERGQQLDTDDAQVKLLERRREAGTLTAEQATRDLASELAAIEQWKAGAQAAYLAGATDAAAWAAAQVRAADAADAAQENYLTRLIATYKQSGDVIKEQATIQQLTTLQVKNAATELGTLTAAVQKHNEFALKMVDDWAALQNQNVAKTWQEATKAAQELVLAQNKLAEAQKNLSLATINKEFSDQKDQIELLASAGIISEEEKAQRLRQIYVQEEQDQLASLNVLLSQQQDAITVAQAKLDQARDNPFFSDAQLDNLQKNLDQALAVYTNTQMQIVNAQTRADSQVAQADAQILKRASSSWSNYFAAIISGSLKSGKAVVLLGDLVAQGIGASVEAAVTGSEGFGEAMRDMLKSALASVAGLAITKAAEQIAWAFEDLADPFLASLAPGHFLAAAKWGAVGAAAAIAGAAVPSDQGSQGGSDSAPGNLPPTQQTAATTAQPNPVQAQNIQHFARGGLVTQPTMAIFGDSRSGGRAREAAIPLDDPQAVAAIVEALGGGRSVVENHFHIKGDIIDHAQLMKKMSRAQNRGTGRLVAGTAFRVQKR